MAEEDGDLIIQAECMGRKCFIIDRDYWHLTHDGGVLGHNVHISKGFTYSVSALNQTTNFHSATTNFGAGSRFSDKEKAWEAVRESEFPLLPTRRNAMFLFDSNELAKRAAMEWFGNDNRILVRAQIVVGSMAFRADAKWLDEITIENFKERARKYWLGELTDDPMPEIIVCGGVYFPDWEQWARILDP